MKKIQLIDNMAFMAGMPDKFIDLAIIDTPYGIGEDGKKNHSRSVSAKSKQYTPKNWDGKPHGKKFFIELLRVSKNQIIWGANHFISHIPYDSSCWLVWDKKNGNNDFADCELAWTSFNTAVRIFRYRWHGMLQENMKDKEIRIHPTQKPIPLYEWCLMNYAKEGDKILDTNLGSQSSRIAADKLGYEFYGCDNDEEHFNDGCKRFEQYKSQIRLF